MSARIIQEQVRPSQISTNCTTTCQCCAGLPCCQRKQGGQIDLTEEFDKPADLSGLDTFSLTQSQGVDCGYTLDIDSTLSTLLKMYSIHVDTDNDSRTPPMLVSSGGLQQFLNRRLPRSELEAKQPRKGAGSESMTFHDLPDSIQLEIFSYLGAEDLCRIAPVCRHWFMLTSDDLLWSRRLQADMCCWHVVGHGTNPDMYKECQSDWTNKEIYLRCSPDVHQSFKQQNLGFQQLSSLLRSFWPKKTPKLAMFGPGLEASTSKIARKILEDTSGMFKTTGMFPGQFEGVGSGFTMKMNNATSFNLITLYTSTKREREGWGQNERLQHNRLLQHGNRKPNVDEERVEVGEEEEEFEVRQAVKDLCRTLDAFVFVVDSNQNQGTVAPGQPELVAMLSTVWANPSIPLLVLSCVSETGQSRIPCIDVVRQLKLSQFNRPWHVHDCTVSTMEGVTEALDWAIQQVHRN